MAASINASTSAGVVTTADTSGNLNLQSNGTTIIGYTSTGVTVTGTISASAAEGAFTGVQVGTGSTGNIGWILGNASSSLAGIWSTGVTPSTTNYFIRGDNGLNLYLNATTNVYTRIGNVGVLNVASTGLTVTGTFVPSGKITATTAGIDVPTSALGTCHSGTYTPTLTADYNCSAVTARLSNYTRVGNMVTVFGQANIDPAAADLTGFLISLPVASTFTTTYQASGHVSSLANSASDGPGGIVAMVGVQTVQCYYWAATSANQSVTFSFMYQVV